MKPVKQKLFLLLFQNLRRDTGTDINTVGLYAKAGKNILSIYGKADDDYKLIVEEAGYLKGGEWGDDYQLTDAQLVRLQGRLDEEIELVKEMLERERLLMEEPELVEDDSWEWEFDWRGLTL